MRPTEVGDHGNAACATHCRTGAGNPSKAAMGSQARFFRRKLHCPRLRFMRPLSTLPFAIIQRAVQKRCFSHTKSFGRESGARAVI